jgi:hypothetical protein
MSRTIILAIRTLLHIADPFEPGFHNRPRSFRPDSGNGSILGKYPGDRVKIQENPKIEIDYSGICGMIILYSYAPVQAQKTITGI